jgi:hypothetical protein
VLFVVKRDPQSLKVLLARPERRFGTEFAVAGESSPATARAWASSEYRPLTPSIADDHTGVAQTLR